MMNRTAMEKLGLLKAVAGDVYIDESDGRWIVRFRSAKFQNPIEETNITRDTPDEAIHEAWFWITGEDWRTDWVVAPAEPNCIIQRWRFIEIWWRWDEVTWKPYVIQCKEPHCHEGEE